MVCCKNNCVCNEPTKTVTQIMHEGRRAERHETVYPDGKSVVEIFAEEVRPLKLESRKEVSYKQVVAEEVHERVVDGEVVEKKVYGGDPEVPLKMQSYIATPQNYATVNNDYIRKEDLPALIAQAVRANNDFQPEVAPLFKAQSIVEGNVEAKAKDANSRQNMILAAVAVILTGIVAYFGMTL